MHVVTIHKGVRLLKIYTTNYFLQESFFTTIDKNLKEKFYLKSNRNH